MRLTSSASGTSLRLSARPCAREVHVDVLAVAGALPPHDVAEPLHRLHRRERRRLHHAGLARAASRCVRPSCSHRMRRNVQWPNDTSCAREAHLQRAHQARASRPCTRCARRSCGTASRQWRRIAVRVVGRRRSCVRRRVACAVACAHRAPRPARRPGAQRDLAAVARRIEHREADLERGARPRARRAAAARRRRPRAHSSSITSARGTAGDRQRLEAGARRRRRSSRPSASDAGRARSQRHDHRAEMLVTRVGRARGRLRRSALPP